MPADVARAGAHPGMAGGMAGVGPGLGPSSGPANVMKHGPIGLKTVVVNRGLQIVPTRAQTACPSLAPMSVPVRCPTLAPIPVPMPGPNPGPVPVPVRVPARGLTNVPATVPASAPSLAPGPSQRLPPSCVLAFAFWLLPWPQTWPALRLGALVIDWPLGTGHWSFLCSPSCLLTWPLPAPHLDF